jgi:two-component system sensor histidine kinase BaeS
VRRRLTLAILLTTVAAVLLVGAGTLVLARFGVRRSTEDDLRSQAESTANLLDLGQGEIGQLTTGDLQALRTVVCPAATNGSGSASGAPGGTTPPTTAQPAQPAGRGVNDPAMARLRAVLCTGSGPNALQTTQQTLCDNATSRLDAVQTTDMASARALFCKDPTSSSLDKLQSVWCQNPDAGLNNPNVRVRRAAQALHTFCKLVLDRSNAPSNVQSTLSKESVNLLEIGPDGQVVQGDLPDGLTAAALQPDQLQAGNTVVGSVGSGSFAVAPVDPSVSPMQAILVSRPTDPVRGLVPWFLLASTITLAIGVIVAFSLSDRLTKPLRGATDATARIAAGEAGVRLPEHSQRPEPPRDEIDALAHSINIMAETLERSKGLERQFLLSVSHDLRTPLTSIRGYAEAIADDAVPDPRAAAEVILTESRRLERLVGDLLDLAKLDARSFRFHPTFVDLGEIASDSVDGFRHQGAGRGVDIRFVPAGGPAPVQVDPDRVQQILANLIENALKFARSTITVQVVADQNAARVEVADDGPGIAPEDRPHVFERLYVAGASPAGKEAGSGLGLAIVREMAEAMGGRVAVDANPTGGARLLVWFPTAVPSIGQPPSPAPPRAMPAGPTGPSTWSTTPPAPPPSAPPLPPQPAPPS